ncbi:MAG: phosphohistidine phosphatase SixA [Cyanobacteriota bacterium]|jgi:phosphohistidine phosphatase
MATRRELLLLRHGIAEERDPDPGDQADQADRRRSLTSEGAERTARLISRLCDLDLGCDVVLSSPLRRARQTAELAVAGGLATDLELAAGLAPLADPLPLLERWLGPLSPRPGWRRLALVGHEPDLSTLAALLIGVPMGQAPHALQLKKAGVVLLQCAAAPVANGLAGTARLALLLPPRVLLGPRTIKAPSGR